MLLSKSTEYAIRLVLFVVRTRQDGFIRVREIAEQCGISFYRLSKVTQNLIKAGILNSYTGPNGGVKLAVDPNEVYLFDIMMAMNDKNILDECVLGFETCGEEYPCPLHHSWSASKPTIIQMFKEKSLLNLVEFEQLSKL